ncbi:MAG: DUF1640 domain-containing protein [Methylobacter sp.]|uniref:DUF1640 domain-containing protein n=1 Tax=Methylicorpusculum sp. TaxID=2713644 RepID=UPI002730A485|nr:DUF1640 domain-containing protein [Methylicorpusculum sp.]MDP2429645.1 DUF1640 domain-containing protein [Methylobacter sp.]MDP2178419.1 DUF1640 domain-containing protein [Methylicorpusculum sp.]MDP3053909.1 DUF1640 domain-containing protein [Methylobacter sp.]MDP3360648.1 DUF1640 domain-containing protein [Methylobacter sp.]MDZ4218325.1 DUF1640 domain-containing protein [Methylobacter sp.]
MTTLAFDTYAYIRKLKASGVTEEQACAQVEALSLAFEQFQSELHLSESATKQDVRESELKLELKIAETKVDLIRWIVGAGFLQMALIAALLIKLSAGI